jgi:hypothetical protein
VFGPQSSAPTDCSGGTTVGTANVNNGNNTYNPSAGFTPTSVGTYWWYASYSGDSSNTSSHSGCGAGMASTVVGLPPPPRNTTRPVISGTPKDGQTLKTTSGAWSSPSAVTYTYKWQRCTATGTSCTSITGASHPAYKLTSTDVGHKLRVVVSATDQWQQTGRATAPPVGAVGTPPAPRNTGLPVISGTPKQDLTLRTTNGAWSSPDTLTFAYQWERCTATGTGCIKITGATHSSYKLTSADAHHKITDVVTATDREHQTGHATAKAVGPVQT